MDRLPCAIQRRQLVRVDQPRDEESEFSVVTYNILADYWIRCFAGDTGNSSFCPSEFTFYQSEGKHSLRHKLLMAEVQWLDSDILCLQEVDTAYFSETLKDELSFLGYESFFAEKWIPEGVALAFRHDKFQLEQTETLYFKDLAEFNFKQQNVLEVNEVLLVAVLRHKISKHVLLIGVTHILWGEFLRPVTQLCEIALATQALGHMVSSLEAEGEHVACILCGDFNIESQFPAYEFLKKGKLNDEDEEKLKQFDHIRFAAGTEKPKEIFSDQVSLLNQTKDHLLIPLRNLRSAYKSVMGVEPRYTNREEGGNVWTLDYIWFDANTLNVTAALDVIPESVMTTYVGLPNQYFPSDHLSLKAVFKFNQ